MKPKRYLSPDEILDAIDHCRARAEQFFNDADEGERRARAHYTLGEITEGNREVDLAHKRRRRAMNLLEEKLPYLSGKLSEILTPQLQGIDNGDNSVPA